MIRRVILALIAFIPFFFFGQNNKVVSTIEKHNLMESVLNPNQTLENVTVLSCPIPFKEFLSEGLWEKEVIRKTFTQQDILWMKEQTQSISVTWTESNTKNLRVVSSESFLFFKRKSLWRVSEPIFSIGGNSSIIYYTNFSKDSFIESLDIYKKTEMGWGFKESIFSSIN